MRETIPSFGINPPFLGAKTPLVFAQNYLGKSSQSLLTKNNYLNRSSLKIQPLLDSELSSDLVQQSLEWNPEFDNSKLLLSENLQVNESDNRVDRTKAEFQKLSPTKVYVVEELPLDFTASDTPIQTSTKRKNTRKTTKAKSKTKTPTRKTTSKKTVPDVVKQAHPSIDSNPQRQKRRRSKIDFLLEQQGLGENDVTPAAETISSTSEQNLHIYSSEDLPFQPTALEQSITPVEKETQFVAPAELPNTDTPATIAAPIQLASIPESHQESTLDAVSTTEESVSFSTQKQSDRQLATAEQIIEQTIASRDRAFEPQENPPSQPTAQGISVKPKAAQLQQSTEQKTGITLNQDVETTATEAIPPTSRLFYSSPNLEKQRLHLPLEQRLKQVEGEESPVAEVESNIISNQQLIESNIVPGNLEVTNSSTVEPRDRYSAIPEESEAEIPPTTPKLFTIPEASQEIQPTSTIPVVPDTVVQPLLDAAVDSQQLPSVADAASEQIVALSSSFEPIDNSPSQARQLDTSVTPENISSLQQPVTKPPVALDVLTTPSGAKQIYPASIDEIYEEASVREIKSNTISNQQLTESDLIPSQEVTSYNIFEPRDRDSAIPQESAEVPSVVKPPDRHVSAPDLPVKQSHNVQQQDRFEAESSNQAAHPTFQTEPVDPIASANSQQPPIQEALLERTTGDLETPNSQPELGNERIATSPEQRATQAETESVFPSQIPPQGFAVGGAVPAAPNLTSKTIAASDTVPAMLTPGEFVVNATNAQKHLNILHHINKGGAVEILPETPTKVESSDAAIAPQTAPSSVQRRISHTSLPRVVKTLIPPIQLAEEPAAKNRVTQTDTPQTHYAETPLIFRKPALNASAPPDSIPDRWDSVEDLLFGGTASDNTYTSDSMAVPNSYSNRNASPSNPGTSETIVSSVQLQGFAKGGEVAPDTFTPAQAIAHTIEAPASSQNQANSNDLEMLAREIYHRLRQRLELERERHGFYSGRLPW